MGSNTPEETYPNVSLACNKFSLDLHKILITLSEDNVICSPLSIHIILSLLCQGAKGTTLTEMKNALHLNDVLPVQNEFKSLINTLNERELSLANSLFIQEGFGVLPNFLKLSTNTFNCMISNVDYKQNVLTAQKINEWVGKAIKKKITNVVASEDFNQDTRLILMNTIHFKVRWLNTFDIKSTMNEKFYVMKSNNTSVPNMFQKFIHSHKLVPTMFNSCKYHHGELKDWNARFLEIPYGNEDYTLIIILPNKINGLGILEEKFSWDILKTRIRSYDEIKLYLPRFKIEAKIDLEEALKKLGLQNIFTEEADFSALVHTPLQVSQVFQKIYISVDEGGSSESAATYVCEHLKSGRTSKNSNNQEFRVNHPFMIVIQHTPSTMPLFIGSIRHIPTVS